MARRRHQRLDEDGAEVWVLAPEDVVLRKLTWFRQGGAVSDSQWRDVVGVLRIQEGSLDLDYLRSWSARLGVADLLERALLEVD